MSLPRKSSRKIVVDGRHYRWVAAYERVTHCSAACPLRLVVEQQDRDGQTLIARFANSSGKDEAGRDWVFPRYGAEITPGVVADIIRAGLAAGWHPEESGRPFEMDGEPFLRLPPDPTQPPPGSEDDMKRRFLAAIREQLIASSLAAPACDGAGSSERKPGGPETTESKPA
jgi:hypothetical protein